MPDTLLIRADANPRMGTGHVMRCLSLAEGWQRAGGAVMFALADATPAIEHRLVSEGFSFVRLTTTLGSDDDAMQASGLARQHGATFVITDGYHFDAAYQRTIMAAGLRLLAVDDYGHAEHYAADFVLNQNLSAREEWYRNRDPHTRLLLGTRYVLLREQFLPYREWQRDIPSVARKILVTLGGADPDNVTGKVIEALRNLDVEVKVVVGGSNPNLERLKSQVSASSILTDVSNMPALMAWADIAVAAGGTTSWELAFMGLPSLVIVLADNQVGIAAALANEGISNNLGPHNDIPVVKITSALQSLLTDPSRREAMSRLGRMLVDGNGVARIVGLLAESSSQSVRTAVLKS